MALKGMLIVVAWIFALLAIISAAVEFGLNAHFSSNGVSFINPQNTSTDHLTSGGEASNNTNGQLGDDHFQPASLNAVIPKHKKIRMLRVRGMKSWRRERHRMATLHNKRRGQYMLQSHPSINANIDSTEPMSRNRRHGMAVLKSSDNPVVITRASNLRKDWCRTELLRQRVKERGCHSRTIQNRFCYGQCNSFYIPHETFEIQNTTAFQSCAFCKPFVSRWTSVLLHCPGLIPPVRKSRVLRIIKCRCISEVVN